MADDNQADTRQSELKAVHGAWLRPFVVSPVVAYLLGALLLAGLPLGGYTFRQALFEPFRTPSGSMSPTVLAGDHILVSKFRYGLRLPFLGEIFSWDDPSHDDVVVLEYPEDPRLTYVERIVAVGGDKISVEKHRIILNGQPLELEPAREAEYVDTNCAQMQLQSYTEGNHIVWIGPEHGPFATTKPIVVPDDHYFVMGDNRSNAHDSR
ncbi:MAG: signal peptidase I, partial [Proteobacteria bacterium]|nr:signal peptidase I [Pseudomonadota bacterium]